MANQVVQITAGSGTKIQTFENTIGANICEAQAMAIVDQYGAAIATGFPAGFLNTSDQPRQILYEPFDAALDTTNYWTTPTVGNSATLATVTAGVMSMATGTTASGWSKLLTQTSFKPMVPAWIGYSSAIGLPDGAAPIANSYRFWGAGTIPAVPTTAAPLTDAIGFEIATTGKMYAVVYAAGVRTAVQDLSTSGNSTQPLDASSHRYIVYIRTDKVYWYIDGVSSTNLVATSNFQSPTVQTLPATFLAVGGSTPPVTTAQIQCSGTAVWDTGKNTSQLADGAFPWRKATVKPASTAAGATDTALVVAISPNNTVAATQSGTWTVAQGTSAAAAGAWMTKTTDGTNVAAVKAASTLAAATDPALVVSLSPNSPVVQSAITKGTQGTTGVTTQDLKDAGRVRVTIGFQSTAPATADTLLSMVKTSAGVAAGGATSIGVTSNKTLRITAVAFSLKAAAATAAFATMTLRSNPAGATLIGSQSELRLDLGNTAAVIGAADKVTLAIPDGIEFSGTQTIGVSLAAQATTNIISIALMGFEY
jgi:hypothetical protein